MVLSNFHTIATMWTIAGYGVHNFLWAVIMLLSGRLVPLAFYPGWMQAALRWLPFGGAVDAPFRFCIGASAPAEIVRAVPLQLIWSAPLALLGRRLLDRALRRVVVQGGETLNGFRLYCRLIAASIRGQLQYRTSFLLMAAGNFIVAVADFMAVWILFARFGLLRGWRLPEVALFYGLISTSFAFSEAFARGFDTFGGQVRSGEFDRILCRPRSTAPQVLGHDFQILRAGRFLQGFLILFIAAGRLGVVWTCGRILLLLGAFLGGVALFTGLMIVQATMCFWSIQSLEIINSFTYGGVETAQFPLPIYARWFRNIFIYLIPLACVSYFPALVIMDRPDALDSPSLVPLRVAAPGIHLSRGGARRLAVWSGKVPIHWQLKSCWMR